MIISVFDRVENIVGKGENAGYQHFLLFPQCFENVCLPDTSKGVIVWEWVKGVQVTSGRYSVPRNNVLARSCRGVFVACSDSSACDRCSCS